MASRLTMFTILLSLAFAFYFLAISPLIAHGYTMTYYQQDSGTTSPITAYPPSFFSPNSCTMQITGYSTTNDTDGLFFLNNQYYSGSSVLGETGYNPYTGNIACKSFSSVNSTETRLGFYEASMKSIFTASPSLDSWLKVKYYCAESGDTFIYNNSGSTDLFGFHPFSYGGATYSFCNCIYGSGCSLCSSRGSNLTRFMEVYKEILRTTEYPCGTIMSRDKAGDASYGIGSGGLSFDMSYEKYISIPFRTGATGQVNFSVFGFRYTGSASITPLYHVYNPANNQTHTLGSAFPLYAAETLEPNTDYFFIIGMHVAYAGSSPMVLTYIGVNFSISVSTYVPNWSCEYSECVNSIRLYSCVDTNGRLTPRFGEEACTTGETETFFNITLGFENWYKRPVYRCYAFLSGPASCGTGIMTDDVMLPTGWTNLATRDISNVFLENGVKITSAYGAVTGSNALLMRYIPPKVAEPINNTISGGYPYPLTVCGNKTSGSSGTLSAPYDNSSYISTNISLSQNPEISLFLKKCPVNENQYDVTNAFLWWGWVNETCGKLFYDGSENGDKPINGNFMISVTGWTNRSVYIPVSYTAITPDYMLNNVSIKDNKTDYIITWDSFMTPYGIRINTSVNITNGSVLKLYLFPDTTGYDLRVHAGDNIYTYMLGYAPITTKGFYNITLTLESETNTFYLLSGDGMSFYLDYVEITKSENQTQEYVNYVYSSDTSTDATSEWEKRTIPLSHLGLLDTGLYTISLGVTPKSDSLLENNPTCVLFDDFRVQNSISVITDAGECAKQSKCNMSTGQKVYTSGIWNGFSCTITVSSKYDSRCLTASELGAKNAIEAGTSLEAWYCTTDGVYHLWDTTINEWTHNLNTTLCMESEPPNPYAGSVVESFIDLKAFNFMLSPLMIAFYIIMAISGVSTFYTKSWEVGLVTTIMMILGVSLASGGAIIPVWVSFIIAIAILLIFAYKMSGVAQRGTG